MKSFQLRWGYSLLVPVYAVRGCNFRCDFHDIENNILFFFFRLFLLVKIDDFEIDKKFHSLKKWIVKRLKGFYLKI